MGLIYFGFKVDGFHTLYAGIEKGRLYHDVACDVRTTQGLEPFGSKQTDIMGRTAFGNSREREEGGKAGDVKTMRKRRKPCSMSAPALLGRVFET